MITDDLQWIEKHHSRSLIQGKQNRLEIPKKKKNQFKW